MKRVKLTRRGMLALGLVSGGAAVGGVAIGAVRVDTEQAGKTLLSDLKPPKPFRVPLPVPPTVEPKSTENGVDLYELIQKPAEMEIIPGTRTVVWGYDGVFPGPTFDVRRGRPIRVRVTNELPVPTSTHLHGGVTPADSDGFPTDLVVPVGMGGKLKLGGHSHMEIDESVWSLHDGSRDYEYPLDQPAATLWYHDHRMDFTGPQVWRGLAGLFIVRDDVEDELPLPEGEREVPLVITDRAFGADGAFKYPANDNRLMTQPGVIGEFHQGVEGDVILVNGAPWPYLDVAAVKYRLRFLNASNARRYRLALDPAPDGTVFTQIGSDAGLLAEPVELDEFDLAPAERRDVVVDFSGYRPGTAVTLVNRIGEGRAAEVMRFVVGDKASDDAEVPKRLAGVERLTESDAVRSRTFRFDSREHLWTINGEGYDPAGSLAKVKLGSVEKWTLTSDFHHPVHIHLGHFQVLSRNGKSPLATDAGWKDTVDVRPFEVVELLVRFEGFKGRYMMHCHNLEHEDMAMMANFDVVLAARGAQS